MTSGGDINLVPLIDILTSIVFFSLLTYTGAALAMLTAFDLTLPPVVVTAETETSGLEPEDVLNLLLAVRIQQEGTLRVEHSAAGGFVQEIRGFSEASLDEFQQLMAQIRQQYPQNEDVLVVPDDAIAYDDLVNVMERLKMADLTNISLASRARAAVPAGGG